MYLARFSPHRLMSSLSEMELKKIWKAVHEVASASIENRQPISHMEPQATDVQQGGEFTNLVYGMETSVNDCKIESFTDRNGRTVWWCPEEQK